MDGHDPRGEKDRADEEAVHRVVHVCARREPFGGAQRDGITEPLVSVGLEKDQQEDRQWSRGHETEVFRAARDEERTPREQGTCQP